MATDKYPKHKALNPFFDVVMKGLKGLVDGEHYYDAIAEDAQFDFLYRFPGWTEVIHGRDNLISAYSGYGNNIKRALLMTTDSCPSSPSRIERLFAGEITWTLLPHGRRSLGIENRDRYSLEAAAGIRRRGAVSEQELAELRVLPVRLDAGSGSVYLLFDNLP
jgi:hypothetical protein